VATKEDGRIKLYLVHRALEHRRRRARLYGEGGYTPLKPQGSRGEHVVAFGRHRERAAVIAIAPRLVARLNPPGPPVGPLWSGTWLPLPDGWAFRVFRNVLTGEAVDAVTRDGRPGLPLETALATFPVALLEAADEP
jgi:(1->4)-alpha-D-glucan 1-alpha-D-glucosylmutase